MNNTFSNHIVDAIMRRFGRDYAQAEHDLGRLEPAILVDIDAETIRVPVVASVKALYDKDLLTFTVEGRSKLRDTNKWAVARHMATTSEFAHHGTAAVVNHLLDQVRGDIMRSLAEDLVDRRERR